MPIMSARIRIDVYSDTVCPWCYLGKRRLEVALAERPRYAVRVTYRPFELNPDMPTEGVQRPQYVNLKVGDPGRAAAFEDTLTRHG